jgi:hypothetical protein
VALTAYQTQTQRLLQNPGAPSTLYSLTDINSYINTARGQVAGEGECCRFLGTLITSPGVIAYNFSSINVGIPAVTGLQGVINVSSALYNVGTGKQWMRPRPWPWFQLYKMNNPVPFQGAPQVWSQYGQGAAPPGLGGSSTGGSLYIDPPPDIAYTLTLDCVCYPIPLANDSTAEAIPYLWTDAVPFYAAWYALLSAQTSTRRADAEAYYGYYQQFVQRARQAANPGVDGYGYRQSPDPTTMNKLGLPQKAAGGG